MAPVTTSVTAHKLVDASRGRVWVCSNRDRTTKKNTLVGRAWGLWPGPMPLPRPGSSNRNHDKWLHGTWNSKVELFIFNGWCLEAIKYPERPVCVCVYTCVCVCMCVPRSARAQASTKIRLQRRDRSEVYQVTSSSSPFFQGRIPSLIQTRAKLLLQISMSGFSEQQRS